MARVDFAAVVHEHWTAVYKLLQTLTNNRHDTEDLTQETFLRALAKLDTFLADTNLRAWLLRIASNAYFDVHRKRSRIAMQPLTDLPGKPESPGRALEINEDGERIRKALGELSETTRMVFHLRVAEDLAFREIGQVVGVSEEAARWHMHQARTRLLTSVSDLKPETGTP